MLSIPVKNTSPSSTIQWNTLGSCGDLTISWWKIDPLTRDLKTRKPRSPNLTFAFLFWSRVRVWPQFWLHRRNWFTHWRLYPCSSQKVRQRSMAPLQPFIRNCVGRAHELRKLPLCSTDYDINIMNIILMKRMVRSMEFWIGKRHIGCLWAWRHVPLSSWQPKAYPTDMEKAFRTGLFCYALIGARECLDELQLSMEIGMIMDTFVWAQKSATSVACRCL